MYVGRRDHRGGIRAIAPLQTRPMAINSALRRFGRPRGGPESTAPREPIAVGEVESPGFNCPRCARPLAVGATICPGCGTRLLFGVQTRLALRFTAAGLAVGVLLGGGVVFVARPDQASSLAGAGAGTGAGAPNAVGASPSPAWLRPADVGIPSGAVSALRQAAILNARFTAHAGELKAILKRKGSEGIDVARVLRALNSDAAFGVDLAPAIAPWPEAAKLSRDLGSFYQAVRKASQRGLQASLSDKSAYRATGKRMSALLAKLPALDAAAARIVTEAGLAPLVEPAPSAPAAP